MTPQIKKLILTGGATYDEITVLPQMGLKFIAIKSISSVAIKIKFSLTGDEVFVPVGSVWQAPPNLEEWRNPSIYVNGTGTIDIEYWS